MCIRRVFMYGLCMYIKFVLMRSALKLILFYAKKLERSEYETKKEKKSESREEKRVTCLC